MATQQSVREHRCDFWALFWPSKDIPDQWVAHCLNLDIVSQGNSLSHACEMLFEAVALSLTDDLIANRSPIERPSAPAEDWKTLEGVLENGEPVKFSEISTSVDQQKGRRLTVATMMKLTVRIERRAAAADNLVRVPDASETHVMPAWMCAAVSNPPNNLHA